jgi:flagellar motor switch protein FliG
MFVFEDIVLLDDRSIQKVMREVDSQELAKALKSVDTEVQDKIFRNMSKRAAGMLKEDMEYMGPVRLKDVEESQQKIVSIIRHLEDTGEIVIARAGEDELVV